METIIKKNFYLNLLKTIFSILFPFITYPYAAKILLPDGIGKVDFVISIISYFQLLASLGINTYAITEGSKLKNNKYAFNKFASEIFSINIMSTFVSYILLLVMSAINCFQSYNLLIMIVSTSMVFNLLGVNWIFYIFEDFKYITVRTISFQFIALLLLILLVHTPDDIAIYALLTVFSSVGSNILNFFYSRKYVKICYMIPNIEIIRRHFKPILILFFASATSSIYLNFDKTILGITYGDTSVGLYGVSVKIISVILVLIIALRDVFLPRIAYYISTNNNNEVRNLVYNGLSLIYLIIIPSVLGIFTMSENLILLIANDAFINASLCLKILAIKLLFAPINGFLAYQILVPQRMENVVGNITACGAIINIMLNLAFIESLAINGVAIASVLSEIVIFCLLLKHINVYVSWSILLQQIVQFTIASLPIIILYYFLDKYLGGNIFLLINTILSIFIYFAILYCLKNKTLLAMINNN